MTPQTNEPPPLKAPELFDLTGQVALVTGGSRGLGLQCAEGLAECGATVVLIARNEGKLAAARQSLVNRGLRAVHIAADIQSKDARESAVGSVLDQFGAINILVNAAGTTWGAPAESHPWDAWQKVLEVNVSATFGLIQEVAARAMIPQGKGRIVNIVSIAGFLGNDHREMKTVAYSTSKGAIVQMTRALAAEWGPRNITVNAIAPGIFPTDMTRSTLETIGPQVIARTPSGRLGNCNDLKGPVVLFSSDAGAHITGQMLVVDGGYSII